MLRTTTITLKIAAAVIWYIGAAVLLIKSGALFLQLHTKGLHPFINLVLIGTGLIIGWIKEKFLFSKACKQNLNRIDNLIAPRIWQFYRIRFFFFLFLMILFGAYAAKVAQTNTSILMALAVLETTVGTALALSSRHFWKT